jgi:hypothetical protein
MQAVAKERDKDSRKVMFRRAGTLVLVLAALALLGCAGRPIGPLSPQEIAAHGTMDMAAPREAVFDACLLALRMGGYDIEEAEPEIAIAIVRLKGERARPADGPGKRSRGYIVEVRDAKSGGVRVTVTPIAGDGTPHRPDDPIWDLDHERAGLARLFEDVRMLMARRTGAED